MKVKKSHTSHPQKKDSYRNEIGLLKKKMR